MLRHKLVSTLALLLVLAAPSFGAAATSAGPPPEEPHGRLAALLGDLFQRAAELWSQPAAGGNVTAADSGGSGGTGGPGGEGQGGYDPNGAHENPEAEGLRTPSTGAAR